MKRKRNEPGVVRPQAYRPYYLVLTGEANEPEGIALYYIAQTGGQRVLPLFTSQRKAEKYIQRTLMRADGGALMDMIESAGPKAASGVSEGRYYLTRMKLIEMVGIMAAFDIGGVAIDIGAPGEHPVFSLPSMPGDGSDR